MFDDLVAQDHFAFKPIGAIIVASSFVVISRLVVFLVLARWGCFSIDVELSQ